MEDFPKHYNKIKALYPDFFEVYEVLGETAKNAGPVDKRMAHLIQLAAAAAIRSEGGVHSHARRALEEGVSIEEIRHALLLLTPTIGFPTMMAAMSWIKDVINE